MNLLYNNIVYLISFSINILLLACLITLFKIKVVKAKKSDEVYILKYKKDYRADEIISMCNFYSKLLKATVIPLKEGELTLEGYTKKQVLELFDLYKDEDDLK